MHINNLFQDAPQEAHELHGATVVARVTQHAPFHVLRCAKWLLDGCDADCFIDTFLRTCDAYKSLHAWLAVTQQTDNSHTSPAFRYVNKL